MDTDERIAALEARLAQLEQDNAAMKRMLRLDMQIGEAAYDWGTGLPVSEIPRNGRRHKAPLQWRTVTLTPPSQYWRLGEPPKAHFLLGVRLRWSNWLQAPTISVATVAKVAVEGEIHSHSRDGLYATLAEGLQREFPGAYPSKSLSNAMLHDCLARAVEARAA